MHSRGAALPQLLSWWVRHCASPRPYIATHKSRFASHSFGPSLPNDAKAVVVKEPQLLRSGAVAWYLRMLEKHPIATKSVTACAIYVCADLTSQAISSSQLQNAELSKFPTWDIARTLRMAACGLFVSGPSLHVWFAFLSKALPKRDMISVLKKMVLGQTVYGPTFTAFFFSFNGLAQGETTKEVARRLRRDMVPTLQSGLMYWPICDLMTYRYVPVQFQLRTNLEVADNSGARRVQCIKVLGGGRGARLGDSIIASVKDATPRGKVKKGEVVNCVIVRTAMQNQRKDGSEVKFDSNAVVIVDKQGEPLGTRIFGPVPHELRDRSLVKILTMAEHVT